LKHNNLKLVMRHEPKRILWLKC